MSTRSGATAPPQPHLRLRRASLGYRGSDPLVEPFDFSLFPGEWLVVAGPNGAGKSTFVKALLGTVPLLGGEREVVTGGLRFGYVPQREHLDPMWPLSVRDLVLMGAAPLLAPFRRPSIALRERATELVELVGLAEIAGASFGTLSGGQQQRALIARALLPRPDVLILDEPANHLDVPGERDHVELLRSIHEALAPSVVVISHSLSMLLPRADRVVVLRDGTFQQGAPAAMVEGGGLDGLLDEATSWDVGGWRR